MGLPPAPVDHHRTGERGGSGDRGGSENGGRGGREGGKRGGGGGTRPAAAVSL